MATTEQIRKWYHPGVVLNHADRGKAGYKPRCNHRHPTIGIPREGGGVFNEPCHPLTHEAWRAYVQVMVHHGETITGAGGLDNCRNIGSSTRPSLHAYLCALDNPPNRRKSRAFLRDVRAIRTNSGAQVFRNLIFDRMHDQINCSPTALATGIDWTTVVGYEEEGDDDMKYADIYKRWTAAEIQLMYDRGQFQASSADYYISDIGIYSKVGDWETMTAACLASGVALPTAGSGGLSEADVKAIINGSQIVAP